MKWIPIALCLCTFAAQARSAEKPAPVVALTPKEIADGWIVLFDGQSKFGWLSGGDVKLEAGVLILSGGKSGQMTSTTPMPLSFELLAEGKWIGSGGSSIIVGGNGASLPAGEWGQFRMTCQPKGIGFSFTYERRDLGGEWSKPMGGAGGRRYPPFAQATASIGSVAHIRWIKARPLATESLFNGKNLDGWKAFAGDPKLAAAKFAITADGELSVKNGPGGLLTERQFDDFILQFECKTLGCGAAGGALFRCADGHYQHGYEARIHNVFVGDPARPADFGTGAIYQLAKARKVVSCDGEWFTMTVAAFGPHVATWVNGYQTTDWNDRRQPNADPRQGLRTAKGTLAFHGIDPTTDLLFRNIRIAEIPRPPVRK
ncbi:MAG TPA: DUF1080 domain-containing protein [Gemmataceae bacterium]|jgi:hypothetical protein